MATATIMRLSPTMPSQGSYDYLYQANVGLDNLHSVWAHGPSREGKENGRTSRRAKLSASSSLYDTSSPYAADIFALQLEYRLACAVGRRSIQLRDRTVDRPTAPMSIRPNLPRTDKPEAVAEHSVLEDWSNDYAFDDDLNPFVLARDEPKGAVERRRTVVDKTNHATQDPKAPLPVLSPVSVENVQASRRDTPSEFKPKTPTPAPVHAPKARRSMRQPRPDPSDRRWRAPGPSPLSHSFTAVAPSEGNEDDLSDEDEDEFCFLRVFRRHRRRLTISSLPRTLGGKPGGNGRVVTPLRRELHKSRFLGRVCFLDVEAPELDCMDERSMEWLLDTQADLLRGRLAIPGLVQFAISDVPRLGTSHRSLKWARGSSFPRRVKDYGKAANDMLARRRAMETAIAA